MQTITVNLNLSRGSCRINQSLYLGETVALSFSESGAYSLILTEPFADTPKDGIVVWAQSTATGELSLNRKSLHSAFKKAEAMQPNMTISAKCFAISEDGQTVADGEVAIEYSPKAFVIDEEDYPSAREILSQATSAKDQAIAAKDSAIAAKAQAESAQTEAEKAKAQAISESRSATTEKEKAQQAATLAAQHATTATNASSSALKAQTEAEKAQNSAETAASAAQAAKDEAQGIANETAQQQVEKVRQELLPLISEKANSAEFDKVVEKIATLIGNDDGYSVRQIAAGLVAEVVAGADKGFDTLKEIADWILNDTTGAAALANAAEDLKNKTLNLENSKANRTELEAKADATALETEVTRAKSAEGILQQNLVVHAGDDEAHFAEGEKGELTSAINENKIAIQENNKTLTAAINKVASEIENIDLSDYRKKKDHVFLASNEPLIVAAKGIEEYESVEDIPLEKSLMIDVVSYWDEDEIEERSVASFYAPHTDFFTDDIGLNSAFWLSANQWSEGGEIEFRAAPRIPMRFCTEGEDGTYRGGFIFEHVKEEWDEEHEEQIYKISHMSFNCNAFEAEADNIFFIGHDYKLYGWGGATTISNDQLYLQAQYEVYDEESGEGEYKLGIGMEGGQINLNAYGGSVHTSADYITTRSPMIENNAEWFSASCFDTYQPEHFDMALSNGGSWIDGGCMGLELASYYSRDEYLGSKISLLPDGIYMQSENYVPEYDYYAGYISLATPSLEIATQFYIKNGRDVIGTDGIRIGTEFNQEENKFNSATLEAHYDWENETSNVSLRGNGEVETYIVVNDFGCIDIRGASIEVSSPDGEESVILTCSDLIKLKALIS